MHSRRHALRTSALLRRSVHGRSGPGLQPRRIAGHRSCAHVTTRRAHRRSRTQAARQCRQQQPRRLAARSRPLVPARLDLRRWRTQLFMGLRHHNAPSSAPRLNRTVAGRRGLDGGGGAGRRRHLVRLLPQRARGLAVQRNQQGHPADWSGALGGSRRHVGGSRRRHRRPQRHARSRFPGPLRVLFPVREILTVAGRRGGADGVGRPGPSRRKSHSVARTHMGARAREIAGKQQ